jgi:hypothetical protein
VHSLWKPLFAVTRSVSLCVDGDLQRVKARPSKSVVLGHLRPFSVSVARPSGPCINKCTETGLPLSLNTDDPAIFCRDRTVMYPLLAFPRSVDEDPKNLTGFWCFPEYGRYIPGGRSCAVSGFYGLYSENAAPGPGPPCSHTFNLLNWWQDVSCSSLYGEAPSTSNVVSRVQLWAVLLRRNPTGERDRTNCMPHVIVRPRQPIREWK